MKNPWLWESLAVAPPAAFDITCNSVGVRASLTDTFGVNLVARYTQSVLGFTGEDSVNFFPPAPEPLQSTQTDKQFFGRGEAVWSLFDGRFKNFFGLDYTNEWNHNVDPNSILVFRHLVPNHHYLL